MEGPPNTTNLIEMNYPTVNCLILSKENSLLTQTQQQVTIFLKHIMFLYLVFNPIYFEILFNFYSMLKYVMQIDMKLGLVVLVPYPLNTSGKNLHDKMGKHGTKLVSN